MKAQFIKWALTVAAAAVSAVPMVFPAAQPFAAVFAGLAGVIVGGVHIPRPGDSKAAQ